MQADNSNNYSYNKKLQPLANKLRKEMTKAEASLWKYVLKAKMMRGYQFRRQRPVLNYIADFMCPELRLVIEVDGITHCFQETVAKDTRKEHDLSSIGIRVLRFTDDDVLKNIHGVARRIEDVIGEIEGSTPCTPASGGQKSPSPPAGDKKESIPTAGTQKESVVMKIHKHHQTMNGRHIFTLFFAFFILPFAFATASLAVPETNEVRVTDVTVSSFSLVWMTDVAADPGVEVYADKSMLQRVTEGLVIAPMPAGSSAAAQAARTKGIMKAQVSGAQPATTYYVRAVTKDPANPDSVGYSALQEVKTASTVALYRTVNTTAQGLSNDLVAFPVYVRPADQAAEPRLGDLVILEAHESPYPISAFAGDGALSPEGILDLNNLFGADGASLAVSGGEIITLRIYRAGNLSTLTHYRRAPQNSAVVSVVGPLKGYFADINLDGKVDDQDFAEFKSLYRTTANDTTYNPDFNFVEDPEGKVDVRSFGKFSKEYGRTDVQ